MYKNDPRIITCKFDSICAETGQKIKKGDQAVYYPSEKKIYAMDSKQAKEFQDWKFDIDYLGASY